MRKTMRAHVYLQMTNGVRNNKVIVDERNNTCACAFADDE